ncbi:MAG: TonB-dependent receptor, partial [Lentisphaeraceae bacterium]|nr:TonB-dependent receptor [Lentisphaeraceae bacterium]
MTKNLLTCILFICFITPCAFPQDEELWDYTFEELSQIKIVSATLTEVENREIPGALTVIDRAMIKASAARSLNELLDIYVPNIQVIRHHWESDHLGIRGIMNDREDKYLLLVNGRNMNQKTHSGAQIERDIPLLGDIYRVELIRGPASAIYGPGAISMVINIITENADTFTGSELTVTGGAIEEFATLEFKHGLKLNNDSALYLYLGFGKYTGAKASNSPEKLSFAGTTFFGDIVESGKPVSYDVGRDNRSHRDTPDIKLHLNFKKGNWDNWLRFTRGGRNYSHAYPLLFAAPQGWFTSPLHSSIKTAGYPSSGYQQLTLLSSYLQKLRDTLTLKYTLSFDSQEFSRDQWFLDQSFREDELYGQLMINWDTTENQKIALAIEGSYEEFGRDSHTYRAPTELPSPWSTSIYSLVGEYQLHINDKWLMILGGRADKHSYSQEMYSPRAAFIYKLNDRDTLKYLISKSQRHNKAKEMRSTYINDGSNSKTEKIVNYEFRWEREHSQNLFWGFSAYYHDMELLAYNENDQASTIVGEQAIFGADLELKYSTDRLQVWFSHGFSKLDQLKLAEGVDRSLSSSAPNGYGDDLANWSNHITKLSLIYKFNRKLEFNSSLRVYWGLSGHEDFAQFELETKNVPGYDGKNERSFEESIFWNLGFKYKFTEKTTLSVNGYNLLGIFDEDLNKRNY